MLTHLVYHILLCSIPYLFVGFLQPMKQLKLLSISKRQKQKKRKRKEGNNIK